MKPILWSVTNILLLLGAAVLCFLPPRSAIAATVDIMIVYDTSAASWVAGRGGMALFASETINKMNQAMANSGMGEHQFRLVHAMAVDYTTTSDGSTSLSPDISVLRAGDGVFAPVHSARNDYAADLVAMVVDTGSAYGYVGIGNLLLTWAGAENSCYTVNAIRSVDISHTLTHEVGHNLGAHHAKTQTSDPGPNTWLDNHYSAGWYFTGTNSINYHTIMAYNNDGYGNSYVPAPLFSTPLVNHQGIAAGDADDGDNSRLIRQTIAAVAGYRPVVTPLYSLTVNANGTSAVAIASSPAIYAGTTNYVRSDITSGTSITLTAPATSGSATFSSWSGCDSTATVSRTCTVLITGNRTVAANYTTLSNPTVTASAGTGGSVTPSSRMVAHGATASFTVTPNSGYSHGTVGGTCPGGSFSGNTYTTGAITANCTVSFNFSQVQRTVTASAGSGGEVTPSSRLVGHGSTASFTVTPESGYSHGAVGGTCPIGSFSGNTYTTEPITANCSVIFTFTDLPGCTPLTNGTPLNVALSQDEEKCYSIAVSSTATDLEIELNNLTENLDLYTRFGEIPTKSSYDCRSNSAGTSQENCTHLEPTAGTWFMMIHGDQAGSGQLTATVAEKRVKPFPWLEFLPAILF